MNEWRWWTDCCMILAVQSSISLKYCLRWEMRDEARPARHCCISADARLACEKKCTNDNFSALPLSPVVHHYVEEHPFGPLLSETAWQDDGKRLTANNYTAGADPRYARRRNAQRPLKRPGGKGRREWVGVEEKEREVDYLFARRLYRTGLKRHHH